MGGFRSGHVSYLMRRCQVHARKSCNTDIWVIVQVGSDFGIITLLSYHI